PYLYDLDSILRCVDFNPDYILALGTCSSDGIAFDPILPLAGINPPFDVCVRPIRATSGGLNFRVESMTLQLIVMRRQDETKVFGRPFTNGLPTRLPLGGGLVTGGSYRLSLSVTDGNTKPVTAGQQFVYGGEQFLDFAFGGTPSARATANGSV